MPQGTSGCSSRDSVISKIVWGSPVKGLSQRRAGRSDHQHSSSSGHSGATVQVQKQVTVRQDSFTHYYSPLKGVKTP